MHHSSRRKRRPRRRIGIPKGMLHHITLGILKLEPRSGTELMDAIEYYTDWRPSPGSIYPLLSKLDEQGLIMPVESDDPALKKYALTPTGIKAIEKHRKIGPDFRSRYHSIQKMYLKLFRGMHEDLFEAYSRLFNAIERIHPLIKNNPEASSKIQEFLQETAEKIKEINRQLEKQK